MERVGKWKLVSTCSGTKVHSTIGKMFSVMAYWGANVSCTTHVKGCGVVPTLRPELPPDTYFKLRKVSLP